ncbi:MAG TPA: HTTM domain-containing protein [Polyangiaceae bacterium]|nr:HTTM domain-containing protein [Polyangiaceae bacterium]
MSSPTATVRLSARTVWAWLVRTYATVDPRSLGVCRILLGLLVFADVARRYKDLDAYYTNLGWLTNHFSLYKPMSSHVFSLYHAFSTPGEVRVLFFVHCAINVLFLVGYRTRLTQLLAWVLLSSMNSRNIIIENGGFVMLTLLLMWSWFLPLGRRFSVDAWLEAWRSRRERTLDDLNDRSRPRLPVAPVVSLAVTAIILQWAINYFLNTVHKDGPTWRDGSAIYYFVQQSRLLHAPGVWLRDHTPYMVLEWLTHGTLIVEAAIAFLWVSPLFPKVARMLAWVLGIGLHLGIFVFATLGPFVWIMMIPYAMFIPREVWEWTSARMRRERRRLVMFLDARSPLSLGIGRLVKRLDTLELIRFAPADSKQAARTLTVAREPAAVPVQAPSTGRAAVAEVVSALPWPRWCLRLMLAAGMGGVLHACSSRLLRARGMWAQRLGLDLPALAEQAEPSRAVLALRRWARAVGTVALVFLLAVCTSQVLLENRAVPTRLKPTSRPEWVSALVVYGRMFQGWSMFAPDPPREDGWVVVDGRTADGRKLDPLTGRAPNFSLSLPYGPDFSAQWEAFNMRIHEKRFSTYYPGFQDFLKNHHLLSGKPADALIAFDVWYVGRYINPPGQGFSKNFYRKLFSFGTLTDSGVPESERPKRAATEPARSGKTTRSLPVTPRVRQLGQRSQRESPGRLLETPAAVGQREIAGRPPRPPEQRPLVAPRRPAPTPPPTPAP